MSSVVRVTAVFEMLVEDGLKIAPVLYCYYFCLFFVFDCYAVAVVMVLFSFYCLKKVACMVNCELSLGRSTVVAVTFTVGFVVAYVTTSYFYLPKERSFMAAVFIFPIDKLMLVVLTGTKQLSSFRFVSFLPMLTDYFY